MVCVRKGKKQEAQRERRRWSGEEGVDKRKDWVFAMEARSRKKGTEGLGRKGWSCCSFFCWLGECFTTSSKKFATNGSSGAQKPTQWTASQQEWWKQSIQKEQNRHTSKNGETPLKMQGKQSLLVNNKQREHKNKQRGRVRSEKKPRAPRKGTNAPHKNEEEIEGERERERERERVSTCSFATKGKSKRTRRTSNNGCCCCFHCCCCCSGFPLCLRLLLLGCPPLLLNVFLVVLFLLGGCLASFDGRTQKNKPPHYRKKGFWEVRYRFITLLGVSPPIAKPLKLCCLFWSMKAKL